MFFDHATNSFSDISRCKVSGKRRFKRRREILSVEANCAARVYILLRPPEGMLSNNSRTPDLNGSDRELSGLSRSLPRPVGFYIGSSSFSAPQPVKKSKDTLKPTIRVTVPLVLPICPTLIRIVPKPVLKLYVQRTLKEYLNRVSKDIR